MARWVIFVQCASRSKILSLTWFVLIYKDSDILVKDRVIPVSNLPMGTDLGKLLIADTIT